MTEPIQVATGDEITLQIPGGRTVKVWVHDCPSCTSVDVWSSRGHEIEEISTRTGDKTRAPMGVFAWRDGGRKTIEGWEPTEGTHGWPATSTVTVIWNDAVTPI